MKNVTELKPCPFCGGKAEIDMRRNYRNIRTGDIEQAVAIHCVGPEVCNADMMLCLADVPDMSADEIAEFVTEMWNRRAE